VKIAAIGRAIDHPRLDIVTIKQPTPSTLIGYDTLIISGGDGLIRRVVGMIETFQTKPTLIINPTGSFNVIAKLHRIPKLSQILEVIATSGVLKTKSIPYYRLNSEIFLFSAGNMGDLHHIFFSESLRFGWMRNGSFKYILAILFLLPMHLILTPFMLMSDKRFFVFIPFSWVKKLGSFYGRIEEKKRFDLQNSYNILELDGDIVIIHEPIIEIEPKGAVDIVVG